MCTRPVQLLESAGILKENGKQEDAGELWEFKEVDQ